MPNINAPSGLAPVMYRNGSPWNGQARLYKIAAALNVANGGIFVGDMVSIDSTNFAAADGVPYVQQTTTGAGNSVRGVVVAIGIATPGQLQGGPYVDFNNLSRTFRPAGTASTDYVALVVDDPNVLFEIQESTNSTPGQAAQMSKNASPIRATPATGSFVSATQLDSSTYGTGATLQLKVHGAVQRSGNDAYQAFQKLLVSINQHDFSAGVAGV
jgi:hypothetical protein